MAHLRKYSSSENTSQKPVHFDPRCVDGVSYTTTTRSTSIYPHLISNKEYRIDISSADVDVDQWIQENIVAIAGENPDTSGC